MDLSLGGRRRHLAALPGAQLCPGLNDDPQYRDWMGGPQDGTPDGPKLHSIIVDPRVAIGGRPAAYVTNDGGRSWQRQDRGLPRGQAWWTVKRQAMTHDLRDPVGVYLGTTSGEIWASRSEGASWSCVARHLPEVYALETSLLRCPCES